MPNLLGRLLRHRRAGQQTLLWHRPELHAPEFVLTSPAFDHRTAIPRRYRARLFGPNISPALAWSTPPGGTAELLLVVQDPDAPRAQPATHALTTGIPAVLHGLPEEALAEPSPVAGLRNGRGALGRRGWAGPAPIPSHGPHAYVFQLFALDRHLELPERFTLTDAERAMAGHVVGRARLDGTYEIP